MKISGYITIKNPLLQNYPFEAAVRSIVNLVDEIIVCDTSNKEDGTKELLEQLKLEFKEFKVVNNPNCDWARPDHGKFDGENKAFARNNCSGDFCLQIDSDEIFVGSRKQIEILANKLDNENPIIALPVIEPWGSSFNKCRIDVNIWKERISINNPNITHGIPATHKRIIANELYSWPGSDGCNLIYKDSGIPINVLKFINEQTEQIRLAAIKNVNYVNQYESWVNKITDRMPYVVHFSWWSVYQKMLKYKNFWADSWSSLYYERKPPGSNPFFNKSFSEVSDEEMRQLAIKLESETCGWIFHSPWDGSCTNGIKFYKTMPKVVEEWANKNRT